MAVVYLAARTGDIRIIEEMRQLDSHRLSQSKDFILNRHKLSVPSVGQIRSTTKRKDSSAIPLLSKDNLDNMRKHQFEQFLKKERKKQSLSELDLQGNKETSIRIRYFNAGSELNPDRPSLAGFSALEIPEASPLKPQKQDLFPAKYEKVTGVSHLDQNPQFAG